MTTPRRTAAQIKAQRRQARRAKQRQERANWSARNDRNVVDKYSFPEVGLVLRRVPTGHEVRWTLPDDANDRLMGVGRVRRMIEALELAAVLDARQDGLSWDDIGWCLEVSGEAARKRLSPRVDAALTQP